mmetsp:Transcript_167689/g.533213  ORF Transcript_167689/g.533213 Transcript_167689/m.533213 type:complete len:206 (-) Transcript_167689:54-671(-)
MHQVEERQGRSTRSLTWRLRAWGLYLARPLLQRPRTEVLHRSHMQRARTDALRSSRMMQQQRTEALHRFRTQRPRTEASHRSRMQHSRTEALRRSHMQRPRTDALRSSCTQHPRTEALHSSRMSGCSTCMQGLRRKSFPSRNGMVSEPAMHRIRNYCLGQCVLAHVVDMLHESRCFAEQGPSVVRSHHFLVPRVLAKLMHTRCAR